MNQDSKAKEELIEEIARLRKRVIELEHLDSERKKLQGTSEKDLMQSWERYRALVEETSDLITVVDRDGNFTFVNRAAESIFGLKPQECVGLSAFDFVHPDDRERIKNEFRTWINDKVAHASSQNRQVSRTGQVRKMLWAINAHFDSAGEVVDIFSIAHDITEREIVEESLCQSEERYRGIVDNIGIGVALISPEMEVLSLNNQMKKWNPHVDLKDKHICYRSFNNPPREEICSYCPTIKTLKDGLVHEDITETPMGGQIFNYRIVASPIKDKSGKVIAAIEMVEDITERKKLEKENSRYMEELKVFYKAAMGREERILELKNELEILRKRVKGE